ncbi:hypothetical protein [Amphibacillus jilinensis]|uniref:hypothetical protein n=1 Tax=Amphibacillus jilinensis TaxID=1216008 RepID=UPI000382D95E|nr:hypothetical protein [Amphibacillus jilinensis]
MKKIIERYKVINEKWTSGSEKIDRKLEKFQPIVSALEIIASLVLGFFLFHNLLFKITGTRYFADTIQSLSEQQDLLEQKFYGLSALLFLSGLLPFLMIRINGFLLNKIDKKMKKTKTSTV